jgi:hexokinase
LQLFDHIAACLAEFIEKYSLHTQQLPLGLTFSFPCRQYGLSSAVLIDWTKGFCASEVENRDVGAMLRDAVQRRDV